MKIGIGIPSSDVICTDTAFCLSNLYVTMLKAGYDPPDLLNGRASVPSQNQNSIIQRALDRDLDWLMLIDSDMTFPGDTIIRLMAHDLSMVGGVYRLRKPPYSLAFRPKDREEIPVDQTGLVEADWLASGMILVKRQVLLDVGYPWMEETYGKSPDDLVGHDVGFCMSVQRAGYRMWADFDLSAQVQHIGMQPIGL